MVTIYHLPDEVVSHIFTLGCEPEDNSALAFESHPRQMKYFARLASKVCKWWSNLTESKTNRHLWLCSVTLALDRDVVEEIATARLYLQASQGCDVDVRIWYGWWEPTVDVGPTAEADLSILSPHSTATRLVLHFIKYLSAFTQQWRDISFQTTQPETLYLIYSILNQTTKTPSLIRLDLDKPSLGIAMQLLKPSDIHSIVSELYDGDSTGLTLNISPQLKNHGQITFHQIQLDNVDRLSSNLQGLKLRDYGSDDKWIWKTAARIAPTLRRFELRLDSQTKPNASPLSVRDFSLSRYSFSFLKVLILRTDPTVLWDALKAFDFHALIRLELDTRLRSSIGDFPSSRKATLRALEYLSFEADLESILYGWHLITAPQLQMIEVDIAPIERHDVSDIRNRYMGKTITAPRCVKFFSSIEAITVVSLVDFGNTEALELHIREFYSETSPPEWPELSLPNLSSITLAADAASSFFQSSQFHNLCSLTLEAHEDTRPINLWQLWSEHQELLTSVVNLQLHSSAFEASNPNYTFNPLLSVPVKHLTIEGSSECSVFRSLLCIVNIHGQILWNNLETMRVLIWSGYDQPIVRQDLELALIQVVGWFRRQGVLYEWQRTLETNEKVGMSYQLIQVS